MGTFRPSHVRNKASCFDHSVTNAIFSCFSRTAIFEGKKVDITFDQEQVVFSDGDYEVGGTETVICFRTCQVPNPCDGQQICVGQEIYNVGRVVHKDTACICVTVTTCEDC